MTQLLEALFQAGMIVLIAFIGYVAQWIAAYFKKEGLLTEWENKRAYAEIIVQAIQQLFQEADGPEKYEKAKAHLIALLNRHHLTFTETELNLLIEAAVKSMKDGMKQGWKEGE